MDNIEVPKNRGRRRERISIEEAAMVYIDKDGNLQPVKVSGEYIDNCTDCSCENIMQPCEACKRKLSDTIKS